MFKYDAIFKELTTLHDEGTLDTFRYHTAMSLILYLDSIDVNVIKLEHDAFFIFELWLVSTHKHRIYDFRITMKNIITSHRYSDYTVGGTKYNECKIHNFSEECLQ